MNRSVLAAASMLMACTPTLAADLDGPIYRERDIYYAPPPAYDPPAVVQRQRIIERHYYHDPAPVETYVVSRVYVPPVVGYRGAYYDGGYRPVRSYWGSPRGNYWGHRHYNRGW